jgi:hypothetical protein
MKRGREFFMRKAGKRDKHHAATRDGLRKLGHTVIDCAGLGNGVLDLLVYRRAHVVPIWVEVKTGDEQLTPAERDFVRMLSARGIPWAVVRSFDEALEAVT